MTRPLPARAESPGWWRVFLPLDNDEFLVPDERVFYDSRYHSAMLLQPAFELMAVLTLVVWARLDIGLTRSTLAAIMVIGAIVVLRRFVLDIAWSWKRMAVVAGAVVVLAIALRLDADVIAAVIVLGFAVRFGLRWLRWAYYRRLLVTDRRVIEVDGLIGSSVATMPLFRITDALLQRTPVAEILGYALFKIESAGQDQALGRINFLDRADEFQSLVIQLSTTAKTDTPIGAKGGDLEREIDRML